jgi:cytoskeletal protein CcmA (bactofilin family)
MNPRTSSRFLSLAMLAALCMLAAARPALAKHNMRINVESDDVRHGDTLVPKGETLRQDLAATGAIVVDGTVDGDCASLGNSVAVNGDVRGDVAALGGAAEVPGTITGDLAVLGAPAHISGTVHGDVAVMGGNVTLDEHAVVDGDVSMLGGKLVKADGAVVKGSVNHLDLALAKSFLPLIGKLHRMPDLAEKFSPLKKVAQFVMFLVFAAGMGLMVVLLTVLLPKQVETAAAMITADFWKAAAVGALILMLTFPGFLLMVVSILGIPLIPLAMLFYCVALIMALAAFSLVLAGRFCELRGQPRPVTLAAVALGYGLLVGLLALGKFLEIGGTMGSLLGGIFVLANLILLSCGMVVGLGALWLTRMGTTGRLGAVPPAPVLQG